MFHQIEKVIITIAIFKLNFFKFRADNAKCTGVNSVWNPDNSSCLCGKNMWGIRCQYGRFRITEPQGYLILTEDGYDNESKYIFLIDSGRNNSIITFSLNKFATECIYDNLFIFDGNSIYSPLLASFSGVIQSIDNPKSILNDAITVKSTSGVALLYFYSDKHISELGFNISYQVSYCNQSFCSNDELCIHSKNCTCGDFQNRDFCSVQAQSYCCISYNLVTGKSICEQCTSDLSKFPLTMRASHAMATINSDLFIYGGYSFDNRKLDKLIRYNLETFNFVEYETSLQNRYDHSMVSYGDKLIIFGGILFSKDTNKTQVTNEIRKYESITNSWSVVNPIVLNGDFPIAVYGHASVVVNGVMYTFFGYNDKEFIHHVQTLDLTTNVWTLVKTTGDVVSGSYKHSASYDIQTDTIFIYGGFRNDKKITSQLLLFQVSLKKWTIGLSSKLPLMLHASGIIGRNLLIHGGIANNSSNKNTISECHSKDTLVYNIDCKSWSVISGNLLLSNGRYGHAIVSFKKSLYIVGGFNGVFLDDLFKITAKGDCSQYTKQEMCLSAPLIVGCLWTNDGACIELNTLLPESSIKRPICTDICATITEGCLACTSFGCGWDSDKSLCVKAPLLNDSKVIISNKDCKEVCSSLTDCNACKLMSYCRWTNQNNCVYTALVKSVEGFCFTSEKNISCKEIKNCSTCLSANYSSLCIWCESQQQCVNSQTYPISYPYGQCLEWISDGCQNVKCELQVTCQKCFQLPGCGWCDDGSGTGLGWCSKGTDNGSFNNTCQKKNWYFTDCPACNCNGHSKCLNGTNDCGVCEGFTEGINCEKCKFGFFGNPENNNSCEECTCNGHMQDCNPDGTCVCDLNGATGKYCDSCDKNGFVGNATNGGFCYFKLLVDYKYPQNLSKYTVAAYSVKPNLKEDSDLKIDIKRNAGGFALINISVYYDDQPSIVIISNAKVDYSTTIKKEMFSSNGEARIVLYDNSISTWSNIRFGLLSYNVYGQQQQEHEVRLNRPFKTLSILLTKNKTQKEHSCVAFEPFANQLYGVASVLVKLPCGNSNFTPRGQCGLCIGSTVTLMPQRWSLSHIQKHSQCKKK